MAEGTTIVFNIGAGTLIIGICLFFFALLAVIWKGKSEISETVKDQITPVGRNINNMASAIIEVQTILRDKFTGLNFAYSLVEKGTSPLKPTEYGASLIVDSGLQDVLDKNKEILCTKLKAALSTEPTEYDVQEKARDLLLSLKDDAMMNPVKEWVYTHPIDITVILRVGGLWLRDDFLKQPRDVSKEAKES